MDPREITDHRANGLNDALTIRVLDEKGPGGANHKYRIDGKIVGNAVQEFCEVNFQKGPIAEAGVNGVSNEALIAIVIDRLRGFQSGQFACEDNAQAQEYLEQALNRLNARTKDRVARGVEGQSKA